jgi:phage N-6-adenine-methyltransferase
LRAHQKPFHSGPEILPLRQARKGRYTQARIAARAGLSLPTVRLLERGTGNQASLLKLTAALEVWIEGRNLPPGPTLGARLAALRKRRGFTQRSLAAALKLAPATVNRLENTDASSVAVICRVIAYLGAGAYLAATAAPRPFYTQAGNSSVHHRWTTPRALLASLYAVFGTFDLDPCSPTANRRKAPVRARMHFTEADNGLALPWHGLVFVNPPYGREIRQWVHKARAEVTEGRAGPVAALLPARTDTLWWHREIAGSAHIVLIRGRLSFGDGTPAPFPSALVIWGAGPQHIAALKREFPDAWHVAPAQ